MRQGNDVMEGNNRINESPISTEFKVHSKFTPVGLAPELLYQSKWVEDSWPYSLVQ